MEESGHEDLSGFLIKPFQRICRYVLLLKELRKHTPEDWPDYPGLCQAIEQIDSIVKEANETKRMLDNLIKINEICEAVSGFVNIALLLFTISLIAAYNCSRSIPIYF